MFTRFSEWENNSNFVGGNDGKLTLNKKNLASLGGRHTSSPRTKLNFIFQNVNDLNVYKRFPFGDLQLDEIRGIIFKRNTVSPRSHHLLMRAKVVSGHVLKLRSNNLPLKPTKIPIYQLIMAAKKFKMHADDSSKRGLPFDQAQGPPPPTQM